jgi:hypothetical protein
LAAPTDPSTPSKLVKIRLISASSEDDQVSILCPRMRKHRADLVAGLISSPLYKSSLNAEDQIRSLKSATLNSVYLPTGCAWICESLHRAAS